MTKRVLPILFVTMLGGVVLPSVTGGASAFAANTTPDMNEAKKHYGEGEKKFKAGDYAGALTEFTAAEAIKPAVQAERFIGLCHDNLGHFADAVAFYEKFLAAVPDKMKKEGDEIKARVATIKAMPGHIHVETNPPGAAILADGKSMGTTPADIELTPGKHIVHLELAGFLPIDRDLDVSYGQKADVKSELAAKPAETTAVAVTTPPPDTTKPVEPPKEEKKEPRSKLPAFITGGLAIVAVGVGTTFGILALMKKSDFDKTPTNDIANTGENFALVADMAFGVAITLGVTSAVLFFTNDDDAPATTPPAKAAQGETHRKIAKKHPVKIIPTPFILPSGGGVGALVRF